MLDEKRPLTPQGLRFLRSCERWARVWVWTLGIGLLLTLVGVFPSVIGTIGALGIVWMPILVLIFWGRLLDELGFSRANRGDGAG